MHDKTLSPLPTQQPNLTAREREVLTLLVSGLTNKQIAESLVVSPSTVNIHVQAIYRKLNLKSRSAVTRYVTMQGLV